MLGIEVHSHRTAGQLLEVIGGLSSMRPLAVDTSAAVVACIFAIRRLAPVLPGPLLVVAGAIATSAALNFAGHGIRVVGPLPAGLPSLGFPEVNWKDVGKLLPVAVSCFVMIVAQSSATARAYAWRHHQRLDENKDLLGLAAANVAAAFSGTFVVDGSPTQTTMVVRAGGNSQATHLSAAAVAALVLLFLTGQLTFLPLCVLSAVVFTIVIGLIDLRRLREIRNESPGEFYLALTTAATVVLVGVEEGILLAMALSLLRIVRHSYHPHTAVLVQDVKREWHLTPVVPGAETESGLVIYRFGAPLFYANVNRFAEEIRTLVEQPPAPVRWVLVDAGAITHIDYTAARSVRQLQQDLISRGVCLAFAHVGSDLRADLDRHRLTETIGAAALRYLA